MCCNGLTGTCKKCRATYHRAWKWKNRERLSLRRRELYEQSEKIIEARRRRERWVKDPIRQRARSLRAGMRARSKKIGLAFDSETLTRDYLAKTLREAPNCPCCGTKFQMQPSGKVPSDASPSVDRFLPHLGYTVENVVILCWRCNNIKRNYSAADLRRVAAWIDSWGNETTKFGTAK